MTEQVLDAPAAAPPRVEDAGFVARRRTALALLFLAFTFSIMDRQIVSILAEPIKNELHLADWQLG